MLQDEDLVAIPYKLFAIFSNADFFDMLMANFNEYATELAILIITVPGSSCYTIGYRMAVIGRFIFDIEYKTSPLYESETEEEELAEAEEAVEEVEELVE